jgi:hypothetical protein
MGIIYDDILVGDGRKLILICSVELALLIINANLLR